MPPSSTPGALLRLLQSGGAGMNTLIELSVDGDRLRLRSLAVHYRRDASSGPELSRDTLSGRVAQLRDEGVLCHGVLS